LQKLRWERSAFCQAIACRDTKTPSWFQGSSSICRDSPPDDAILVLIPAFEVLAQFLLEHHLVDGDLGKQHESDLILGESAVAIEVYHLEPREDRGQVRLRASQIVTRIDVAAFAWILTRLAGLAQAWGPGGPFGRLHGRAGTWRCRAGTGLSRSGGGKSAGKRACPRRWRTRRWVRCACHRSTLPSPRRHPRSLHTFMYAPPRAAAYISV
jgi:hypothetical protein